MIDPLTSQVHTSAHPAGLFRKGGKIYQVYGFLYYMDAQEIHVHKLDHIRQPLWANIAAFQGFGDPRDPDNHYSIRINKQLKGCGINPSHCMYLLSPLNTCIVFRLYSQPISITTPVTNNEHEAVAAYFKENTYLPQILSDYRLACLLKTNSQRDEGFTVETYNKHFVRHVKPALKTETVHATYAEKTAQIEQRKAELKRNEPAFTLMSDYDEYSSQLNIDLRALRQRIISQAKRAGGFVDFEYKGKTYPIPKLPLIAWATDHKHESVFVMNDLQWRSYSPGGLKIDDDNPFHSDWWIGAGFPIASYKLAVNGNQFSSLNEAVTDFAHELVNKNTLDNIRILSGKDLPPVTGNINIYPESIDAVNPGDILVLPNGNVEFEMYLKKACQGNKGAVILETGNGTAHLSIVSRELGYRVILLPNATKLLKYSPRVNIDTENQRIITLTQDAQTIK